MKRRRKKSLPPLLPIWVKSLALESTGMQAWPKEKIWREGKCLFLQPKFKLIQNFLSKIQILKPFSFFYSLENDFLDSDRSKNQVQVEEVVA